MRERDEELIARLGSDPAALEVFYRRYVHVVTVFAARRCGNAHDVADVVSQTFVRAIVGAHTFKQSRTRDGSARGWLLRIAFNEMSDQRRRETRERVILDREAGRRLLDDTDTDRLDVLIDNARATPAIARALDALSSAERDVVSLVILDELTISEAAVVLGVSPVAVRARLSRGRRRLRQLLGSQFSTIGQPLVASP